MAEAEEYAGGDEDVAAAEQEEDVDEVSREQCVERLRIFQRLSPPLQELETMKQRLKEMEDETNKLTAPAEGSEEGTNNLPPT